MLKVSEVSYDSDGLSILQNVSFSVESGSIVTIIGPNGSGKTTLLKIIMGITQPSSGEVIFDAGIKLSYVPQKFNVDAILPLTVESFLEIYVDRFKDRDYNNFAASLNMDSVMQKNMHRLSGGEMQRVLLYRALLRKPDLLILDEPAQGMDVHGQMMLYNLLDGLVLNEKTTVILVSHDLHFVHSRSHQVICLNKHICCYGKPQEMTDNPEYRKFFGHVLDSFAPYTHNHDHCHDN